MESRLAPAGSGAGLAATIPQGMRACAVKVDDVSNVSGFATPGLHVDVIISGTPPGAQSHPHASSGVENTAAEHSSFVGRHGNYKGSGRQGQAGAGGESAGYPGTGRDTESGQQFLHPASAAQSLGHEIAPVASTDTNSLFTGAVAAAPKPPNAFRRPRPLRRSPFPLKYSMATKALKKNFNLPRDTSEREDCRFDCMFQRVGFASVRRSRLAGSNLSGSFRLRRNCLAGCRQ